MTFSWQLRIAALALLGGLASSESLRAGAPGAMSVPRPCPFPLAISSSGQTWIHCLSKPEMSARELVGSVGTRPVCPRMLPELEGRLVRFGGVLRVGPGCRVTRSRMPSEMRLALGLRLELNLAGEAELTLLPGIGRAIARRMIRWRQRRGCFGDWIDVRTVRGIGPVAIARLRRLATLHCPGSTGANPGRGRNRAR